MTGQAALLLTGTVGVGKTTTSEAVGRLLERTGVPHAVIDLDWLSKGWPAPEADPFQFALLLANLRAVAANFLQAGAQRLVLAGVVETRADRDRYQDALGVPLVVVRLRADLDVVRTRLAGRHAHEEAELGWYLHRSGELDAVLDGANVADHTLDVTGLGVHTAAAAVLAAVDGVGEG
jgi:gluconate kinase